MKSPGFEIANDSEEWRFHIPIKKIISTYEKITIYNRVFSSWNVGFLF